MYSKLLLSFIIGSSCIVALSHWLGFYQLLKKNVAYKDKTEKFKFNIFSLYIIISTFYFGLLNVLITYLRITYNFNIHKIYLVFSILSPLFIISHNLYFKSLWNSYTFNTTKDKIMYGIRNFLKHFIIFNVILKGLELYFNKV